VRVGQALTDLPVIGERFRCGQLSYSQVRALTRVATVDTDRVLADLAEVMTASQLEEVVRAYRRSGRVDADAAGARRHRRRFSWHWDDEGMLVGRLCLPAEEGALMVAAIDADVTPERATEAASDGSEDGWGAARADALMALCEARLATAGDGEDPDAGSRFVVNVLIEQAALTGADGDDGDGTCQVEGGPGLSVATVRRLACDSSTVTVIRDGEGNVLDVGRRTRRIGRRLRRALRTRDSGCRFPGCTARRTQAHHITHWADGGTTSMDNLVSLCSRHHHRHHEGGYRIERPCPGKLLFVRADGRVIDDRPASPGTSRPGGGLPATGRPFHCNWEGEALPLADILTVLHQAAGTLDPHPPDGATTGPGDGGDGRDRPGGESGGPRPGDDSADSSSTALGERSAGDVGGRPGDEPVPIPPGASGGQPPLPPPPPWITDPRLRAKLQLPAG
jgi:hypothetical protein